MRKLYTSKFDAAEIDRILSMAVRHQKITLSDFTALQTSGNVLPDVWYCVYDDSFTNLLRIYVGEYILIEIEGRLDGIMLEEKLSQEEYTRLQREGKTVPGTWYSIFSDYAHKNLTAVYNGNTLIMKKGSEETVGFPYPFPFKF